MPSSGEVLRGFYRAVVQRDFSAARRYLQDDLVFVGLFETYPNADSYLTALQGLMQITVRLDILTVLSEGEEAAVFFELETKEPVKATTLVAEWHRLRDGKIYRTQSAFDGRAFAAMFSGPKSG
jgi:hypothetical protein